MNDDISFETLDLLSTLGMGRKNAKPVALIARQMDVPKRRVIKMIDCARMELEDTAMLIMNTGHGAYYTQEVANASRVEEEPLLPLFYS